MYNNIDEFLQKCINEEQIPHAFLIETNDSEQIMNNIINLLIKNKLIPNQKQENNLSIFVLKPNEESKNYIIDKEQVLNLENFLFTKSMENYYKVYFVISSEYLINTSGNKMLKTIEEPSDKSIGFLLTSDLNLIIPTIKSRCEILKTSDSQVIDENIHNEAIKIKKLLGKPYFSNLSSKKELLNMEKKDLILIFKELKKEYLKDINTSNNYSNIANKIKILDNIIDMLYSNTNVELILDKLFIELGN